LPLNISYSAPHRIASKRNLAKALNIGDEELEYLIAQKNHHYRQKRLPKKSGGTRTVYAPERNLKALQRKIVARIFHLVRFPPYLQGSISDPENQRDYIKCATQHCGAVAVSHIDIKNFFDGIEFDRVVDIFEGVFLFRSEVSLLLAELCTLDGYVPQGAPTSSYIANMIFFKDEPKIVNLANKSGITYTRLVDDITISTDVKNTCLRTLTKKVIRMIESYDLEINADKTKSMIRGSVPLTVHGIRVVEKKPKISRDEYRNIRDAVHRVVLASSTPNYRTKFEYFKLYHRVSGRLSKLKRLEHPGYTRLRNKLKPLLPLPSKGFKAKVTEKIEKLERNYSLSSSHEWYKKEWNVTSYKLGIVGRTYKKESSELRARIKAIRPS